MHKENVVLCLLIAALFIAVSVIFHEKEICPIQAEEEKPVYSYKGYMISPPDLDAVTDTGFYYSMPTFTPTPTLDLKIIKRDSSEYIKSGSQPFFNGRCPICQRMGVKSKVYVGGSYRTLIGWEIYYDENGVLHDEDPNITSTSYTCSNGHHFSSEETYGKNGYYYIEWSEQLMVYPTPVPFDERDDLGDFVGSATEMEGLYIDGTNKHFSGIRILKSGTTTIDTGTGVTVLEYDPELGVWVEHK